MEPYDPLLPTSNVEAGRRVKGRPLPFGVPPPAVPIWPLEKGQGSDLTPGQVVGSYAKTHPYSTGTAKTSSGGAWWDPVTWWHALSATAVAGFDDLTHWILVAVKDAANLLWEALHTVFHLGVRYATDVFHWAEECLVRAESLIRAVWHDAVHLADQLRHDVAHWLDTLRHALAHDFDNIRHWVASAYDKAVSVAWGFLARYVFRYLHTAIHWIEHATDWFGRQLAKAWGELYRTFIRPIVHDVRSILHRLERIEHVVYHDLLAGLHLLEEASDWMLWFAEHSFKDIEHVVDKGEQDLLAWLKTVPPGE